MSLNEMYQALCEMGYEQAVNCLTSINGWNEEAMKDCLYWATGYNDFEQVDF